MGLVAWLRRNERRFDVAWIIAGLVAIAVGVVSENWVLLVAAALWVCRDVYGLLRPQSQVRDELGPQEPAYRTPFDPPRS